MLVELVTVRTDDGWRLDGALHPATGSSELGVDAVLTLHGNGSNFYSSTMFATLAERFVAAGVAVLNVNTRGHDHAYLASQPSARRWLGTAYERVADCTHDVAAWLALLAERGFSRVAIIGHSLGAVKALYSQAFEPSPQVACVVAISPPWLSYAQFMASSRRELFATDFQLATKLIADDRGEELINVNVPLPSQITALGYVDKYGPDEKFNLLRFAGQLNVPTLITFGNLELHHNPAFRGLPEAILALAHEPLRVAVLAGAEHNYTTVLPDLYEFIASWLQKSVPH